uniref:Uncharacterized protein n=1 Tax=Rhizophora mucronata TaxID=61149 RepID=A0A2P2KPH2_RHIMU
MRRMDVQNLSSPLRSANKILETSINLIRCD